MIGNKYNISFGGLSGYPLYLLAAVAVGSGRKLQQPTATAAKRMPLLSGPFIAKYKPTITA